MSKPENVAVIIIEENGSNARVSCAYEGNEPSTCNAMMNFVMDALAHEIGQCNVSAMPMTIH